MKRCGPPSKTPRIGGGKAQATEAASRRTESISSTMKFCTIPSLR
jgi:hypothetical protein